MSSLETLQKRALSDIADCNNAADLDSLRVGLLGKKGEVTALLKSLGGMSPDERREFGGKVNVVKQVIDSAIRAKSDALANVELERKLAEERIDVTLPGRGLGKGGLHPISRVIRRIERLFGDLGFESVSGPEIEDDYHNFAALNIPESHPARAMQDTFYAFNGERLLRTHTSPVQIRTMTERKAPIRIICPGKVYRVDFDRTHSPMFHQVEGLYVAENVTMSNLKYDLMTFLSRFFEREMEVLFRPSYFPFVEPGADVHIRWEDKWLEVLGCGMVHPNVFESVGIDPDKYSGYAFGMGVERFAMLRYAVNDLRLFFNNDQRFLRQFAHGGVV